MEAFLSGIMDENAIPDDLMDEEYYMFDQIGRASCRERVFAVV